MIFMKGKNKTPRWYFKLFNDNLYKYTKKLYIIKSNWNLMKAVRDSISSSFARLKEVLGFGDE